MGSLALPSNSSVIDPTLQASGILPTASLPPSIFWSSLIEIREVSKTFFTFVVSSSRKVQHRDPGQALFGKSVYLFL